MGSHVLLFTDTATIFKEITNERECQALQNGIDLLTEWCLINEIALNVSKYSVITFNRLHFSILRQNKLDAQPLAHSSKA